MTISSIFFKGNHEMSIKLLIFVCILAFIASCKEKEPVQEKILLGSGYILNDELHYFDQVICYRTEWGEIFHAREGLNEHIFVLSDTTQSAYSLTDTVFSTDHGKFRFTLEAMGIYYLYASEGSLQYDRQKNTTHFEVNPFGVNVLDGILIPDTIIWEPFLDFTGITVRDESGVLVDTGDETDWSIRNKWMIAEAQLFNLEDNSTNPGPKSLIAYPNPVQNQCMLDFINTPGYDLEMILVNPNMEIEKIYKGLKDNDMALLLDDPAYNGHNYRLYFHLMRDSSSWYGSGDLNFSE